MEDEEGEDDGHGEADEAKLVRVRPHLFSAGIALLEMITHLKIEDFYKEMDLLTDPSTLCCLNC